MFGREKEPRDLSELPELTRRIDTALSVGGYNRNFIKLGQWCISQEHRVEIG